MRLLNIGDRVRMPMPHSEVCRDMRVADTVMDVEVLERGAQLYKLDGTAFSFPITWGEAGIYTRHNDQRPYVHDPIDVQEASSA